MNILIFGATGTVGAEVVRAAVTDGNVKRITAVTRRPLTARSPKLTTVLHQDYLDYSALAENFTSADACVWCLGVSQSQVSKQQYYTITHDYTLAAAKAMLAAKPNISFIFLSGAGAGPNSKTLFGRVKYETEEDLKKLGFKKLSIARPAGIQPIHLKKNTALTNKLAVPLFPILRIINPNWVITSTKLARALLHIARISPDKTVLNTAELKRLA